MSTALARVRANACRTQRKDIAIWDLLIWAFQRECARIEFNDPVPTDREEIRTVSMEYIMMQRARLGCRVDGGGSSDPHEDADLVANALATLPEGCGGRRMALWLADLARAGRTPQWDIKTMIVPLDTQTNQWGCRAITEDARDLGAQGWPPQPRRNRKGIIVHDAVRYCPVIIRGDAAEVAAARRSYLAWWGALLEIRTTFQIRQDLTAHRVTDVMPVKAPWKERGY